MLCRVELSRTVAIVHELLLAFHAHVEAWAMDAFESRTLDRILAVRALERNVLAVDRRYDVRFEEIFCSHRLELSAFRSCGYVLSRAGESKLATASMLLVGVAVVIPSADDEVAANADRFDIAQGRPYHALHCLEPAVPRDALDRSLAPPSCRSFDRNLYDLRQSIVPKRRVSVSPRRMLFRDNADALYTFHRKTCDRSDIARPQYFPEKRSRYARSSPGRGTAQHPSATRGV